VRRVLGEGATTGVQLRSERVIDCDTVLVATGIRPTIELARATGLHLGRGIRVDDRMLTSDPYIYAVGECAEHRNRVYGIVAPGFEQAAVAAHSIAGGKASYRGSIMATRLKVLNLPVFSVGAVTEEEMPDFRREWRYGEGKAYRKLVTWRGELVGAVAIGACEGIGRLQQAVMRRRRVWPWQVWRFLRSGTLWPAAELGSVATWPATATVCSCTGVTRGAIGAAIAGGCATVESVSARTGASSVCGSCRPLLAQLVGSAASTGPVRGSGVLLGSAGVALIAAAGMALVLAAPYSATVQVAWQWDVLWRDGGWKQTSGFTVLGLSAFGLLLSLRKRFRKLTFGEFSLWRVGHAVLGALTLAALAVHTGGRLGANLNSALMISFLGVVALGAVAAGVVALEHRLGAGAAALRRSWLWSHIVLFWPIPVLLTFHVLKTYYF
jgi:nitrite reductase (NADH) large subunit